MQLFSMNLPSGSNVLCLIILNWFHPCIPNSKWQTIKYSSLFLSLNTSCGPMLTNTCNCRNKLIITNRSGFPSTFQDHIIFLKHYTTHYTPYTWERINPSTPNICLVNKFGPKLIQAMRLFVFSGFIHQLLFFSLLLWFIAFLFLSPHTLWSCPRPQTPMIIFPLL